MQIIMNVFSGIIGYMVRYFQDRSIQKKKFNFDAAIMSHMSKKVFDRYTEFCEKYIEIIPNFLEKLWQTANVKSAIKKLEEEGKKDPLSELLKLRLKYSIYIPTEVSRDLPKLFEDKLIECFKLEFKIKNYQPESSARERAIEEHDNILFNEVLGVPKSARNDEKKKKSAFEEVINKLKLTLKTDFLFESWYNFLKSNGNYKKSKKSSFKFGDWLRFKRENVEK